MAKPKAVNLGALGDELYAKHEAIAAKNEELKQLQAEERAIEDRLLHAMQEAGTDIARGDRATVSISKIVRPQLQDFAAFERFVLRHKAVHLFEKRIAVTAYREMKEKLRGKEIPGVIEYEQTKLNCRKV